LSKKKRNKIIIIISNNKNPELRSKLSNPKKITHFLQIEVKNPSCPQITEEICRSIKNNSYLKVNTIVEQLAEIFLKVKEVFKGANPQRHMGSTKVASLFIE